ncbi:MAG: ribonuclease J [Christensenellales bacterium]
MARKKKQLKVVFLGGVGEIGKNMTALEYGDNIIIIDCGCTFPTVDTPGVDVIVPDFSYLEDNYDKIRGIVITHGHEDHIGGLPYLLDDCRQIPVYGSSLTLALVKHKLKEKGISIPKLNVVKGGEVRKVGCFDVEFISVTHSISGAFALSITTPEGVVFHTGDYKIDYTPISGEHINLSRIAEIGNKGVRLMLGESTNIEKQGSTISETKVGETLDKIIRNNTDKRIIIATFASNINRIQQIISICENLGRRVAFNGRSMKNISVMAKELKLLSAGEQTIVDIDKIGDIEPHKLCIITTGSQGEPMSALTRMCNGEDKVVVGDNDLIIISSSPIPGNEKAVYNVINNLYRRGAKVLYGSLEALHVSGHACQEEIKLMTTLVKPQFFIPVHGEYRHMQQNRELAISLGVNPKNTMIAEIGSCIAVSKKGLTRLDNVVAGNTYVDGLAGVDASILKDRHQLSKEGLVIVLISVSVQDKSMCAPVEVIARGISLDEEQTDYIKSIVEKVFDDTNYNKPEIREEFKGNVRKKINRYFNNKLRQKPMVLPIVMEK